MYKYCYTYKAFGFSTGKIESQGTILFCQKPLVFEHAEKLRSNFWRPRNAKHFYDLGIPFGIPLVSKRWVVWFDTYIRPSGFWASSETLWVSGKQEIPLGFLSSPEYHCSLSSGILSV